MTNNIEKILEIQGLKIESIEQTEKTIEIHFEIEKKVHTCPNCNNKTKYVHDYRIQRIKDISILNKITIMYYRKRRYVCKICNKRFYEVNDFLAKYHRMTKRSYKFIMDKLKDMVTMKYVAKQLSVSPTTIARIFDNIQYTKPSPPTVLSIDEFKGNAGRKYQCIITNPKDRTVLDIVKGRESHILSDYFKDIKNRDNVKYFVIDMWKPFFDIGKTYFKNAEIIIDKFHYIRHVVWNFDKIRKEEQKKFHPNRRKYFKRSKSLLLAYYPSLNAEDKQAVNVMLSLSNKLSMAHCLKELFLDFVYEKDYKNAIYKLNVWYETVDKVLPYDFAKSKKTIMNWQPYILNSIKYNYTNGFTEGFNNKIKVLKRLSFGVRNFERFRNRILHLS